MNDFLNYVNSVKGNYLIPIILSQLILMLSIHFIKQYLSQKLATYNIVIVLLCFLSTILFYYQRYPIEFCIIWGASLIIGLFNFNIILWRVEPEDINNVIPFFDKALYFMSIAVGILVIFLPYMEIMDYNLFQLLGGGKNPKVDTVSIFLFFILGLLLMVLNKGTIKLIKRLFKI